jgi:hypothetical protein
MSRWRLSRISYHKGLLAPRVWGGAPVQSPLSAIVSARKLTQSPTMMSVAEDAAAFFAASARVAAAVRGAGWRRSLMSDCPTRRTSTTAVTFRPHVLVTVETPGVLPRRLAGRAAFDDTHRSCKTNARTDPQRHS